MVILYIIFPWPIKLIPDLVSKLELDKLVWDAKSPSHFFI
jgi:hypothetical protein